MSGYVVVHPFADAKDNGYVYRTGDAYPREGFEPEPVRIADLASTANALGYPVIEVAKVTEKPKAKEKAEKPTKGKSGSKAKSPMPD